jgi:hypothetical protein
LDRAKELVYSALTNKISESLGNKYEIIPPPFVGIIFSIVILPGATVSPLSFLSQLINRIRENKKIDKKFLVFINLKVTTQDSGSSLD